MKNMIVNLREGIDLIIEHGRTVFILIEGKHYQEDYEKELRIFCKERDIPVSSLDRVIKKEISILQDYISKWELVNSLEESISLHKEKAKDMLEWKHDNPKELTKMLIYDIITKLEN